MMRSKLESHQENHRSVSEFRLFHDEALLMYCLYTGQFGRVYKGSLLDETGLNCGVVAIKTLKCRSSNIFPRDKFHSMLMFSQTIRDNRI